MLPLRVGPLLLSVVAMVALLPCLSAAPPNVPSQPAEEEFLTAAGKAAEAGDFGTAELSLGRFRALVGTRQLPNSVKSAVLELEFRTRLEKVKRIARANPNANQFADPLFNDAWAALDKTTEAMSEFLNGMVEATLKRGSSSSALVAVARLQRMRIDRAAALRTASAFPQAIDEIDEARQLYDAHKAVATEKIQTATRSPSGTFKVEKPRGEALGMVDPETLHNEEINLLSQWVLLEEDRPGPKESLLVALDHFVKAYPGGQSTFSYAYRAMECRGKLDPDRLLGVLELTSNKETEQYDSNRISLGNVLFRAKRFDDAKLLFESAVKSEHCPRDRIPECFMQLAGIHEKWGEVEKAVEYYELARSLTDRYQSIESNLLRLEKKNTPLSSAPEATERSVPVGYIVGANAVALALIFALLWFQKRPVGPPRKVP